MVTKCSGWSYLFIWSRTDRTAEKSRLVLKNQYHKFIKHPLRMGKYEKHFNAGNICIDLYFQYLKAFRP